MIDRQLRARMLMEEAHALGLNVADLIAAEARRPEAGPTVAAYLETIRPTFSAATAATYAPYWRLAAARLGDRRLVEVTEVDLAALVTEAADRARQRRPGSTGRASRESCVAAMRALFVRATAAGVVAANPAAALTKPQPTPGPGRPRADRAHRRRPHHQPRPRPRPPRRPVPPRVRRPPPGRPQPGCRRPRPGTGDGLAARERRR